jgi:hypothetical protein
MIKTREPRYILIFLSGIIVVLLIHYFILLRFNLHPTLQVFISFILLWIWLAVVAMIRPGRK